MSAIDPCLAHQYGSQPQLQSVQRLLGRPPKLSMIPPPCFPNFFSKSCTRQHKNVMPESTGKIYLGHYFLLISPLLSQCRPPRLTIMQRTQPQTSPKQMGLFWLSCHQEALKRSSRSRMGFFVRFVTFLNCSQEGKGRQVENFCLLRQGAEMGHWAGVEGCQNQQQKAVQNSCKVSLGCTAGE